jgi:hypothetical protein
MIDEQRLREGLQRLLRDTDKAIRERISDEPSIETHVRERHAAAVRAGRTAGSTTGFNSFADEAITQAAVHWLLGCVFVRFLEDNGWLDERNKIVAWLAGPGEKLEIAKGERTRFLRPDPAMTDRDYLLYVFGEVAKLPGMAGLFDSRHNPLFQLGPTAQGAEKIVEFFRRVDPDTGNLVHDFTDPKHETRFLGDLYQNLSESARERYALCQTPGFIIDFILDRTLTPAIDTFGLEQVRLIDPACGSGHFLLAAFTRLFRLWQLHEPATNPSALAQKALDSVYGVDLNPFAAEISRFRLLIAALKASGVKRLRDSLDFHIQVATGDSLLHGSRPRVVTGVQTGLYEDRLQFFYETEDADEVKRILSQSYHVVVGNPPYINVDDSVLREAYRSRFHTCSGQYQLGVPFTERFFDLTVRGEARSSEPGHMGMIVSNAFMTRAFGKVLVEEYLRHFDLTHVIDTSGLNLPGHGTPTTIILARNQQPIEAKPIRAVRGIVGILSQDEDLAASPVWREIVEHIDQPGFEGTRVSVGDTPREIFGRHPWVMGGGGAAELKALLDQSGTECLSDRIADIGVIGRSSADEIFGSPPRCFAYLDVDTRLVFPLASGECVRDWQLGDLEAALFPEGSSANSQPLEDTGFARWMWPYRTTLGNRATFSQRTYFEEGRPWWGWHQVSLQRLSPPVSIAFAEIATHNHFVLDLGGKIFDQTAPLIKLQAGASEDDHLEILGPLNSSTGCFWLRQVAHDKGGGGVGGGLSSEPWERRKCFTVTVVSRFPLPGSNRAISLTRLLKEEAAARSRAMPTNVCSETVPTTTFLSAACDQASVHLGKMIALQEELDWLCYELYGLIERAPLAPANESLPGLKPGDRAFEIVMAKSGRETSWFERHKSKRMTELPEHWSDAYRQLVERRIELIATNSNIRLIEQPEYKRRWNLSTWAEMQQNALKIWLLDRIETNVIWRENSLISCGQLRDALARDAAWVSVAEIYSSGTEENIDEIVTRLAVTESMPFLPVLRYTDAGIRTRREWEQVWDLQRKEDAGEAVEIPVPKKYRTSDFRRVEYWRLRGSLDVQKERFVLFPGLERDSDRTPVLGWAGWNHLEQAQALAGYYQRMRTEEGWEPARLTPILAGLLDLRPWLLQWHNDLDSETGVRLGEYFVQFAESQCQELGFSPEEVQAWQPPATNSSKPRTRRATARRAQ